MKIDEFNKQRLILISDLWGKEKSEWVSFYTSILSQYFEVVYYDSCDLGNIDKYDYTEENLHQQFVKGGINNAVDNFMLTEKKPTNILGFSVGGYIAWKASLAVLSIENLYLISSTRIRNEKQKPNANIELIFGENDPYKPTANWFENFGIKQRLYLNETHELYKNKNVAKDICKLIINQLTSK